MITRLPDPSSGDHGAQRSEGSGNSPGQSPTPAAAEGSAPRYNFLVINADDMRSDELLLMPHVRQFAEGAVTFRNSFAPNPLCCPSRASFLTGQYSHNHLVKSHDRPYGFSSFDDRATLATALQDAGYQTALVGKYLNWYGARPTRDGEDSLHYVPPGWSEWWGSSDKVWRRGDPFKGGTYNYFNLVSNVNGKIEGWPGQYTTNVTGQQVRHLVDTFSQSDQPWFIWYNPVAPHHGFPAEPDDIHGQEPGDGDRSIWQSPARPEAVKGKFDDVIPRGLGVPAEGVPEDDRSDKPDYLRESTEYNDRDLEALTSLSRQRAEALSVLDDEFARILAQLDRADQRTSTIVIFTSDNGFYLGEHGKRAGKVTPHEPSIRVPLIVAVPGQEPADRFDPISTIDLAPTLLGWAGAQLPHVDGVDMRSVISDGDKGWTRAIALEGLMPDPRYQPAKSQDGFSLRGIRVGKWKLVRYSTGEFELYDLELDPLELSSRSRAGVPRATWRDLQSVWEQLVTCREEVCRTELPPSLALNPKANEMLTEAQAAAERDYYRAE
ncbi:MAG: sulfatase-like hydrolase/transferase [Nocardioides sp.]